VNSSAGRAPDAANQRENTSDFGNQDAWACIGKKARQLKRKGSAMSLPTTTTPADTFRATAAGALIDAAKMDLHQLVDEFQRLTAIMDGAIMDGAITEDERGYRKLNDSGEVAHRQRKLVVGVTRSRFGLSLDAYDRPSSDASSEW